MFGFPYNLIAAAAGALMLMVGSAWVTHRVDLAAYHELELKYADAEKKARADATALQRKFDVDAQEQAKTEAARLADIAAKAAADRDAADKQIAALRRRTRNVPATEDGPISPVLCSALNGLRNGASSDPAAVGCRAPGGGANPGPGGTAAVPSPAP